MKKVRTLINNSQAGPLGMLLLCLIFFVVHGVAIGFKEFAMIPIFYAVVAFAILVSLFLRWAAK